MNGDLVYNANKGRGRVGGDDGQISLRLTPAGSLSFTLDTVYGDRHLGGAGEEAFSVIRPSATFDGGSFTVTLGAENISANDGAVDQTGLALTTSFSGLNLNIATLSDDNTDTDITTFGANYTSGSFGIGLMQSQVDDGAEDPSQTTIYGAYTTPLFDVEGATLTYALSHSSLDDDTATNESVTAGKVRLNYSF